MTEIDELRRRAVAWSTPNHFDDFEVGDRFQHHWGRTITAAEATIFSSLTMAFNPDYFNRETAAAHGHRDLVVNPYLAFNVVFGLSVADLSEAGGVFLGLQDLVFVRDIHPDETLTARSVVRDKRPSRSRPGFGVVTWHTQGLSGEEPVLRFTRSNLIPFRTPSHERTGESQ